MLTYFLCTGYILQWFLSHGMIVFSDTWSSCEERQEWDRRSRKGKIHGEESLSVTEVTGLKAWKVKLGSYVVFFLRCDIWFALVRLLCKFLYTIICSWMLLVAHLHLVSRARKCLSFLSAYRKNVVWFTLVKSDLTQRGQNWETALKFLVKLRNAQ